MLDLRLDMAGLEGSLRRVLGGEVVLPSEVLAGGMEPQVGGWFSGGAGGQKVRDAGHRLPYPVPDSQKRPYPTHFGRPVV